MAKATYWTEYRRCGRADCTACPHGPYWLGRIDGRKRYFGRKDPRPCARAEVSFDAGCNDVNIACNLLGLGLWQSQETAQRIYAGALATCATDSTNDVELRGKLIHAWCVVVAWHGWGAEAPDTGGGL